MDIDSPAATMAPTEQERRDKWRVLVGLVCPPPPAREMNGGRELSADHGFGAGPVASASRIRSDSWSTGGWSV